MSQPMPEPREVLKSVVLSTAARQSLVDFLRRNQARAISEWERAIQAIPAAAMLDSEELRDHMPLLIERVLALVETSASTTAIGDLPDHHAIERMHEGFDLEQVAWEYSVLRSTLLRLNEEGGEPKLDPAAIVLLNDAIDQAVVRAVAKYHRARVRMLEALDRIAREGLLAEPKPLDALLHRLLRVIMDTVESVDTAVLYLREFDRLVLRAAEGLEQEVEGKFTLAVGDGFAGQVAQQRHSLMTHSAESDPRVRNPVLRMSGIKALYGVPLIYGDEVVGVAKMGSRAASDFAADDRQILRSAAERAAAFIAHRRDADERELLLHVLGHDLRSPLNTIVLGSEGTRQDPSLSPTAARKVDRVLSAARRMDRLIGDLTDYTQTRSNDGLSLKPESLDMREVVAEVAREMEGKANHELHVECVGDVTGQWDRGRVLRVIVNVVNNAFAYGTASRPVTLRVEGDPSSVRVHVHNEGPPIPAELVPYLFDAFKRGPRGEGAGLGLYIVQRIVRAHGGRVEVESSVEQGTTFSLHLPRRPS